MIYYDTSFMVSPLSSCLLTYHIYSDMYHTAADLLFKFYWQRLIQVSTSISVFYIAFNSFGMAATNAAEIAGEAVPC